MTPKRIQRKRSKGWRMPAGAVYVGRPTKWGNPWIVRKPEDRAECVRLFQEHIDFYPTEFGMSMEEWLAPLRGKDLACWCPEGQPCHADVLLELANKEPS